MARGTYYGQISARFCSILVHGVYNIGTGIILNDMLNKATLYSDTVSTQRPLLAYAGVAALVCLAPPKAALAAGPTRQPPNPIGLDFGSGRDIC